MTGVNNLNLTNLVVSYTNNTNAGTATASYSYSGNDNYLSSSDSKNFTITSPSASSSGDPYITTFSGLKYKLPNILRTYRLLEYPISNDNTLYVNASISELKISEKEDIVNSALEYGIQHTILNGFFYDNFYIGYY